jgi:DNA-nicking Smr family endonuclease
MNDDEPVQVPIEEAIDLHWFPPADILSVVDEYLLAAQQAGFDVVRVIHGRGKGFQRAAVQQLLTTHTAVDGFWDDSRSHLGATMVRLRKRRPLDESR